MYEELSSHGDEDEVKFVKLGSLKRIGMKARVPLKPDHNGMGPFHLQLPQVGDRPARTYTFEYRSEVISKWYDECFSGRYARFCIFDPQKSVYALRPSWTASPDLNLLKRGGLEALWLPRSRTNYETSVLLGSNQNLFNVYEAEEMLRIPDLDRNRTTPSASKETEDSTGSSDNIPGLNHVYFQPDANGGPWPNSLPDGSQRSSYDLETSFLAEKAAQTGPANSSLMNEPSSSEGGRETDEEDKGSILDGENSDVSVAVNTDSARSFLGSQFPHAEDTGSNSLKGLRFYRELLEEEAENDVILAPIKHEKPAAVRTWFDLAKEYKASHPDVIAVQSECHNEGKKDTSPTTTHQTEDRHRLGSHPVDDAWPDAAKDWTAANPTEELSELHHSDVRLTWPELAKEWTSSRQVEDINHHYNPMKREARRSSSESEDEGIQMTVLKSRAVSSTSELIFSKDRQARSSSAKPTVEHIENIHDENISRFPTTRISSGIAFKSGIGIEHKQHHSQTSDSSDSSSTTSNISITSYVEAEIHARQLWQTVYPHAHGQTQQDFQVEKLSAPSQSRAEDIPDTLYLEVYGRGRRGVISGGRSCNQPIPRPTSVTSFASGFKFSKFADQMGNDSKEDVRLSSQGGDSLPDQLKTSGVTCSLETEGTSQAAVNDSTEVGKSSQASELAAIDEDAKVSGGLVRQTKKSIGALVDIFQAHGLMSNLKSPFTRSSSPTREFRTPTPSARTPDILLRQGSPIPKMTHGKGRAFGSSSSMETIGHSESANLPYSTRSPMHRILEIQHVNDSDFSDAETEVSAFGEALERCNAGGRSGRATESIDEERRIRDNDLYG
jgi:hypothetical protein